jgi:hypothetical protein
LEIFKMSKTLQQILGGENLTGVIQGIKGGIKPSGLPDSFLRPTRTVVGNTGTYKKVEGTRKTARIAQYGSASQRRVLKGVSEVPVTLLHTFEHIMHNPTTLMNLKSLNGSIQRIGEEEVARQTGEFKQLFDNLRVATVLSALCLGKVYFDADGNLLPSSSNAVTTIDYGIPAGNQDQCDILGDGDTISADWSTAGTAIEKDVANIRSQILRLNGYEITHCFYGSNILSYMTGNTKLKEIINRKNSYQDAFTTNEIADGFLKIQKWIPIQDFFYVDNDGSVQSFDVSDKCIFTPTPSPEWWDMLQGTYPIPTSIGNVSADGKAALGSVAIKSGMFSYATVESDPVTIKHNAGDTFLPAIKVPGAVVIADTVNT